MTISFPATTTRSGPLRGIKVLDLSAYIAGPYGCSLLADQGAEVIKIEPPTGDNLRNYPSTLASESRAFLGVNRSKLGLVLDLKNADDHMVLMDLIKSADVLVHNFRPNVPPRLGISYEQLEKINPRLIYCAVTGFGETGPLKDKAGYDQVLQAMTGMSVLQGKKDGPPEILYGSVVDYYASTLISSGVAAALYERERSGKGQYVGVSLMRAALTMQSARMIWADDEPKNIGRDMRSGGVTGIHPTKDGYIYISANTPHFWESLCKKIGLAHLAQDERFNSVRKRSIAEKEIVPLLREALAQKSAFEWEEIFGEEVPCSVTRQIEDMFDFPQVIAEDMIACYDHPIVGKYRGFKNPIKFSRTPASEPFAAPTLGQHNSMIIKS
jgi:formyl-CoA transferase